MFSEPKVIEIYCMTNDFCKKFTLQQKNMIEDKTTTPYNKSNRISDTEMMMIFILFLSDRVCRLKDYCNEICLNPQVLSVPLSIGFNLIFCPVRMHRNTDLTDMK